MGFWGDLMRCRVLSILPSKGPKVALHKANELSNVRFRFMGLDS
jgi:hypothetical protein